jgi:hypothetical protein
MDFHHRPSVLGRIPPLSGKGEQGMGFFDKWLRKLKLPSELNSLDDLKGSALEILAALKTGREWVDNPGDMRLREKLARQLKALGL